MKRKKKQNKNKVEIHLQQRDEIGFLLKTQGTPEDLNNAIISLLAWYATEYIKPESYTKYLMYVLNDLKRKLDTRSIYAMSFDITDLFEQMGGKK